MTTSLPGPFCKSGMPPGHLHNLQDLGQHVQGRQLLQSRLHNAPAKMNMPGFQVHPKTHKKESLRLGYAQQPQPGHPHVENVVRYEVQLLQPVDLPVIKDSA